MPMNAELLAKRGDELLALDRQIPHDPVQPTPLIRRLYAEIYGRGTLDKRTPLEPLLRHAQSGGLQYLGEPR